MDRKRSLVGSPAVESHRKKARTSFDYRSSSFRAAKKLPPNRSNLILPSNGSFSSQSTTSTVRLDVRSKEVSQASKSTPSNSRDRPRTESSNNKSHKCSTTSVNNTNLASQFNPETINALKRKIKTHLSKLKCTIETDKLNKIKESHCANLKLNDDLIDRHEILESDFQIKPIQFTGPSSKPTRKRFKLVGNLGKQEIYSTVLPEESDLPTMRNWDYLQTNCRCPDERYLYNIPYLSKF